MIDALTLHHASPQTERPRNSQHPETTLGMQEETQELSKKLEAPGTKLSAEEDESTKEGLQDIQEDKEFNIKPGLVAQAYNPSCLEG